MKTKLEIILEEELLDHNKFLSERDKEVARWFMGRAIIKAQTLLSDESASAISGRNEYLTPLEALELISLGQEYRQKMVLRPKKE